jgi:hypothetical protein
VPNLVVPFGIKYINFIPKGIIFFYTRLIFYTWVSREQIYTGVKKSLLGVTFFSGVMRLNYLHQETQRGTIELKFIDTDNEVADILTKLLALPKFEHFKSILLHGHGGVQPVAVVKEIPEPNTSSVFKKILKYRMKNKKN